MVPWSFLIFHVNICEYIWIYVNICEYILLFTRSGWGFWPKFISFLFLNLFGKHRWRVECTSHHLMFTDYLRYSEYLCAVPEVNQALSPPPFQAVLTPFSAYSRNILRCENWHNISLNSPLFLSWRTDSYPVFYQNQFRFIHFFWF